jgi:hypothetical protein
MSKKKKKKKSKKKKKDKISGRELKALTSQQVPLHEFLKISSKSRPKQHKKFIKRTKIAFNFLRIN